MENTEEEESMDIQQAFKLFCRGKEKLNPRDLGTVIQSLGRNLPKARLEGMLKKVDSKSDGIDFGQFLGLLAQSENDRDSEGEIREAFKIFDQSNCGTISVMELQRIMTSLGEKLSNEEFDEMLREVHIEGDVLNYEELIKIMMTK